MRQEGYRRRLLERELVAVLEAHPAVLVTGPRSCGKTTTAARLTPDVVRLDVPREAEGFRASPDAALAALPGRPLLLDEWQEVPAVLGAVKRAVDAGAAPGSFILTGSVSADAGQGTWPGTGRVIILPMAPLTVAEREGTIDRPRLLDGLMAHALPPFATWADAPDLVGYIDHALVGGYPDPALRLAGPDRVRWYRSYAAQIAERDVPDLLRRADPARVSAYLVAWAAVSGTVTDHATLFRAAGITRRTAEGYDALLRRLFVVDAIPAWAGNRLSGMVRTPKRVLVDSGLMAGLLGVDGQAVLRDGVLLGRLLETFVIAQISAEIAARFPGVRLTHLRTDKGRHEVDLVLSLGGGRIVGIEVTAAAAPDAAKARHLAWLRDGMGEDFAGGLVLHTGRSAFPLGERIVAAPICALWSGAPA